jgi:hypothetical protein
VRAAAAGREPEHESVGVQGVLKGEALAEELGVPHQVDLVAGRGEPRDPGSQPLGGADGDRRLADHDAGPLQERGERVDGAVDV